MTELQRDELLISLSSNLSNTQVILNNVQQNVIDMRKEMKQMEEGLEKKIDGNTESIKKLENRVTSLEGKVEENTQSIKKLENRVTSLEGKVEENTQRITSLENKVNEDVKGISFILQDLPMFIVEQDKKLQKRIDKHDIEIREIKTQLA